ncbi:hypothetical protein AURDEDRAFT_123942 [Auricularia subglabra TFB-10046 SS5]|nr:hypothetical protein AURDEDRAFT_123942 [Auricularia subglabra TFB-10046 SS5]
MDSMFPDMLDTFGDIDIASFADMFAAATSIFRAFCAFDRLINLAPAAHAVNCHPAAAHPVYLPSRGSVSSDTIVSASSSDKYSQSTLTLSPAVATPEDTRIHSLSGVYAVLNSTDARALSDSVKIAVAGVARSLETMGPTRHTWIAVLNTLMTCPLLSPCPEGDLTRALVLNIRHPNWLSAGAQDDAVIGEVQMWLGQLLRPAKVSLSTADVESIINCARAEIHDFTVHKGERKYKKLVDVGVLCYPDTTSKPANFKLLRIELYAWYGHPADGNRTSRESGIEGFMDVYLTEYSWCPCGIDGYIGGLESPSTKRRSRDSLRNRPKPYLITEPCTAALIVQGILDSLGTYDKVFTWAKVNPAYGEVKRRGYREMNAWLLDAVEAAEQALEDLPPAERTWPAVVQAFQLCPLLVTCPLAAVDRADEYTTRRSNWFKKQPQYRSVAAEVQRWFTRFMQDADVDAARSTVDIDAIYDVVAHAGRIFNENPILKKERQQRTLLDIGVLRYPDLHCPYIKVYRIELVAWSLRTPKADAS